MTKYIRTKDGIYEANKNKVGAWITKLPYKIFDRDIIKQADTIEKLCDEFVVFRPYKVKEDDMFNYQGYEVSKMYMRLYKKDFSYLFSKKVINDLDVVYGAIWTDKGLIYVAKMNEEGELELL